MSNRKTEYAESEFFSCSKCLGRFPISQAYQRRKQCKKCRKITDVLWKTKNIDKARAYSREYQRRNPHRSHQYRISSRYGITPTQYAKMVEDQGGVCAICKKPETRKHSRTGCVQMLSVDHCHKTGKNRGLLCNICNRGIGFFCDDAEVLMQASLYLRSRT